jgi:hypothetical protein
MNSNENTPFQIGSSKRAKKSTKHKKLQKKDKKEKRRIAGSSFVLKSYFLKSWLLGPTHHYSSRIITTLSPYNMTFKERYNRVLYFNTLNDLEKSFINKLPVKETKYMPTQFDCLRAFRENQKLRWAFKKLFLAWKLKKLQLVNETDVITMEPPKNPVYIMDFYTNKKYQVNAKSFILDTVNRFLLHYDFFPESKSPRNLLTNEDLTWAQIWSISQQLKKIGTTHWCWEGYTFHKFHMPDFVSHFEIPLKLEMVNRCFLGSITDSQWYISDFISQNATETQAKWLKWAVYNLNEDPYIQEWKELCFKYWKLAVRKGEQEAEEDPTIVGEVRRLIQNKSGIQQIQRAFRNRHPIIAP